MCMAQWEAVHTLLGRQGPACPWQSDAPLVQEVAASQAFVLKAGPTALASSAALQNVFTQALCCFPQVGRSALCCQFPVLPVPCAASALWMPASFQQAFKPGAIQPELQARMPFSHMLTAVALPVLSVSARHTELACPAFASPTP